jgi:hypothetical protein
MSIEIMTRVWKYSQQSGTALLVLLALADWADDWGYCYPGHAAIARKARTTERNVYLILNKLAEMGEIRIVRKGTGGKRKETSIYHVTVGMTEHEIVQSERLSPIARGVSPENFSPENFSPENFSPENFSPENFSPENSCSALNVLINRQLNAAAVNHVNQEQQHLIDVSPENFSPENFSGEKSFTENQCNDQLPPEIQAQIKALGWRGSLADVEKAWQEDPERVRQWLWYARKQGMSGALLRTVLRNPNEYPPELEPGSELSRRRYLEGPYADYIQH